MKNLGQRTDSKALVNKEDLSTGGSTNVKVDGTSITSNNEADLKTKNGNYNASTNKLATESDIPDISNKVDKTTSNYKVYATNSDGNQTTLTYTQTSSSLTGNTLVQRETGTGQIKVVTTPASSDDATSKSYVDGKVSGLITSSDLLTYVYPVNSVYWSKANVSPASFLGGTWTQILNNATITLGSEFGVQGNGKTLGLTDGTNNVGMATGNNIGQLYFGTGVYNVNVNTSTSWSGTNTKGQYGVVQNTTTSGLKGVASSTLTGVYAWQRTA